MGKKCKEIGIPVYINSGANQISGSNPNSGEIKILTDRINKMGSKLGFAIGELTRMRFQFGSLRSTRFGSTDTDTDTNELKTSVTALSNQIDLVEASIKAKKIEADAALSKANAGLENAQAELVAARNELTVAKEGVKKAGGVSDEVITRLQTELATAKDAVTAAKSAVAKETDRINALAKKLGDILNNTQPPPTVAAFGKK